MSDEPKKENGKPVTRRYFLEAVGGGAIGIAATGSMVLTAQFLSHTLEKVELTNDTLTSGGGGVNTVMGH